MRFCLVTTIVSPHQMPLARQLTSHLGADNFRYVARYAECEGRTQLGWKEASGPPAWVLQPAVQLEHAAEAAAWMANADVVLCGLRDLNLLADRIRRQKVTLYMSERWWKPPWGMLRLLDPRFAWMAFRFRQLANSPWLHYLPTGTRAADDMSRIADFYTPGKLSSCQALARQRNNSATSPSHCSRLHLWGYFTEPPAPPLSCRRREGALRILWAGRMLRLKRVDTLIKAMESLIRDGYDIHLTLVGHGPEESRLRKMANAVARKQGDATRSSESVPPSRDITVIPRIEFQPPVPIAEVRGLMRKADVYVLPSNGYEGWGAVANEAMSEGCAVIASEAAGSAKTMIRDGENGLLFKAGDWRQLAAQLERLYNDEPLRFQLAQAGQKTILTEWSPIVAAERLVALCEALLAHKTPPVFTTGPLS